MKKLILIFALFCQFLISAQDIPSINEKSSLQDLIKFYSFSIKINGQVHDNKLETFRKALSQYSFIEIVNSGILDKAAEISPEAYKRIINHSLASPTNIVANGTIDDLIAFTRSIPIESYGNYMGWHIDYYKTISDLDPPTQTRKDKVIQLLIKLTDSNSIQDRQKALILFTSFRMNYEPAVLNTILTQEVIKTHASTLSRALSGMKNIPPEIVTKIKNYFQEVGMISADNISLFNILKRESFETAMSLLKDKKKAFTAYINESVLALYEEWGSLYDLMTVGYWELEEYAYSISKILLKEKTLVQVFLNRNVDDYYEDFHSAINYKVINNLVKTYPKTDNFVLAHLIFKGHDKSNVPLSNTEKYRIIKNLKKYNKLPPLRDIKNYSFYKSVRDSSKYNQLRLWLLTGPCNGLFTN